MREEKYGEQYGIMKAASMSAAIAASGLLQSEEMHGHRQDRFDREIHPANKPKAKSRATVKAARKQNRRRK